MKDVLEALRNYIEARLDQRDVEHCEVLPGYVQQDFRSKTEDAWEAVLRAAGLDSVSINDPLS